MENTYPLDTAAKLFPSVTRLTNTSVYRLSVVLKETVQPEILQRAAEMALERYPYLAVSLVETVFDQFFVKNARPFQVKQEHKPPCVKIDAADENGYLLRIVWFECRISVEIFHVLADGTGGFEFLKTLLYCYLTLLGKEIDPQGKILLPEEAVKEEEYEDSFLKYYSGSATKVQKMPPAFKIKGEPFEPHGHEVLQGILEIDSLKKAAKQYGATITEYLSALIVHAIYREMVRKEVDDEPIVIAIPVDLRKMFPSKTIRNFFGVLNVSISLEEAETFHGALRAISNQIQEKTQKERLEKVIDESCGVMEHPIVKAVPRFIREAGTRFVFAFFSEDVKTMTISNVGVIDIPDDMKPYVERAESIVYPTERSPINCCMCSVNGKMTISFIKSIKETEMIRYFFRFLAREIGADITICTNRWENDDEQM